MPKPNNVRPFPSTIGRVASMDPADLDTTADLTTILSTPELREAHEGDEWFSLCNFPGYLRTLTNNLRLKVESLSPDGSQPSASVTLDAAIRQGVDDIRAHDDIRAVLTLRREVDGCDEWGVREVEMLAAWFRSFPFDVPNDPLSPTSRLNTQLTSVTKAALFTLASELGVSASKIATLSITQTYAHQHDIFPRTRIQVLEAGVDSWLRLVRLRREVGEELIAGMRRIYGGAGRGGERGR